jgi:hypothetical protein
VSLTALTMVSNGMPHVVPPSIVHIEGASSVVVADSLFVNNTFARGCVAVGGHRMTPWQNVTMIANRATSAGGTFFVDAELIGSCVLTNESTGNVAACFGGAGATTIVGLLANQSVTTMMGNLASFGVRLRDALGPIPDACKGDHDLRAGDIDVVWALLSNRSDSRHFCTVEKSRGSCVGVLPYTSTEVGASVGVALWTPSTPAVSGVNVTIHVVACEAGFAFLGKLCSRCQQGSYSFAKASRACLPCPPGVFCAGGSDFSTTDEVHLVWQNASKTDVAVFDCLPGVCGGGHVQDGVEIVNTCAKDRHGLLCASCTNETFVPIAPSADGTACLFCPPSSSWIAPLAVLAAFAVALALHITSNSDGGKAKILFYYAQVAAIVLPHGFSSAVALSVFSFKVSAATAAFGGVCLANIDHYGLTLVKLCAPLAITCALLLMFATARAFARVRRRGGASSNEVDLVPDNGISDGDGVPALAVENVVDQQQQQQQQQQPAEQQHFWSWGARPPNSGRHCAVDVFSDAQGDA